MEGRASTFNGGYLGDGREVSVEANTNN